MTVNEFITSYSTLSLAERPAFQEGRVRILKRKLKNILREDVLTGGNDMFLSAELNINLQDIENFANQKRR